MKLFFYFIGSLIRWPVLKSKDFLKLHGYFSLIYVITYLLKMGNVNGYQLIFTLGLMAPLLISIGRGLPVNCLDFQAFLDDELKTA